ncbi:MAG TPA: lipase maturation factor family protein [Polyangiales bacterium]|nr:lipase maturation factor family protein [Polyangiales bacterium]
MSSWSLDPLLVWGLFLRGLGLILFISFVSLSHQVVDVAGAGTGVGSIARRMAKIRADFPGWRRFVYFPTLLWLNNSNAMLRALTLVGLCAAGLVVYGGEHAHWALLVCYLCYLSLDLPMGLVFPWDSLLFEATFLSLFLPTTHALPQLTAAAAPDPAVTWMFRLLFFRLMFGFGKQKFLGSRSKDSAYLRGFLIYQPLLSPVGWLAQKLPLPLLKVAVLYMFVTEIPAPFFVFFPGILSVIAAVMTAFLMVGIQLMGNFGYFSIATIVLCIPLLDNITPHAFQLGALFAPGAPQFTHAFFVLHTLSTLVVFPFNSWLGQSWSLWAVWYRLPRVLQPLFTFYRTLHPLRWLHPYGVFPPNNQPGVKVSLLIEVSWDGKAWHELEFKFAPTNERSRPHFVAPHHPRGDQAVIYDTFGLNANSLMSGMVGPWDPYYYATIAPAVEFCQKLCEEKENRFARTAESKNHDTPPRFARVTTVMLEPTTLRELRETGRWWKRTYIGPHVPTHEYDPEFWSDAFGEPELWHPEAIMWRRRSRFAELMKRSLAGKDDPLQLAIWDGQLERADVELFWNELVPLLAAADRSSFDTLPDTAAAFRARFDRKQRRVLARLLGRFTLILVARFEPKFFYQAGNPELKAQSYLHLWMLAQHFIAQGKDTYLRALETPALWNEQVATLTNIEGLYVHSVFRFDEMCFEAQKLRLIDCVAHPHDPAAKQVVMQHLQAKNLDDIPKPQRTVIRLARALSGFFCVMTDIRLNFKGPAFHRGFPELYPTFQELESGDIRIASYAYPKPGDPLAPDLKSLRRGPDLATTGEPVVGTEARQITSV